MTINNPASFMESIWDWAILDGCFGRTKIKPTDVDGLIERNGYFLLLETKRPNVPIPAGQRIMFENLVALKRFTIFIIWGERDTPCKLRIMTPGGIKNIDNADIDVVRGFTQQWFNWAQSKRSTKPDSRNN
jgi:hypothetical protein